MQYQGYIAKITNLANKEEIQDWVQECNITLPNSTYISTLEARFQVDEKKLNKDDIVKIEIFDQWGKTLYVLQGKTSIPKRTKSYTGKEVWEYCIKDSYEKLFDRVIPENLTFYDLYMCNTKDKENSLLHKIARALGFQDTDTDFSDCAYDNGELIRVPFVHLEEKARWIDKLQAFKEASDGILYAKNGKLFFRPRNLAIKGGFSFDRTNMITKIEENEKGVLQNGIKVVYDRFEKLENQVVFHLQKKVITEPDLTLDKIPTMRIAYITSAVSNPTLSKATGYYFPTEDPNSKVEVALQKDVHYKVESWKETMAEIKFLNPFKHKLYVDNFEIKGVPLSMYEDNEVNVMLKTVEQKHQENFMTKNKNKLVQTSRQSEFLAKKAMRRDILNNKEYRFKTKFLDEIEVGGAYRMELEDINTVIEIKSIHINLRTSQFTMDIQADCIQEELGEIKLTTKTTATPKGTYIDLKPLEDKVKQAEGKVKLLEQDIRSTLHKMETQPTENVKENDVWLNPKTNVWKKFYNGVWNPISEKEILPSMKLYNSIETNVIKLQGTADKVGAYLLNGGEKFGGMNGELAHATFDKLGQFEAENPNNRVALNIKDPANPQRVTSQILLGVTNVKDPKWKDTVFAIGDEASPNRIEFKNGQVKQTVNGKELGEVLKKEEEKNYYRGLMASGKMLYPDPEFRLGGNSTGTYNNEDNGLVKTFLWEPARDNPHYPPNDSGKVMVVSKKEGEVVPNMGGFYFSTQSRKEAIFITKIVAKIPEGHYIDFGSNAVGNTPRFIGWLTSDRGTGRYETYIYAMQCGVNGSFGTTNHYYISADDGNNTKAIEWYVAYATVFDCSADSQEFIKKVEGKIDSLQTGLERQITFEVGGEANKYYPVFFTAERKLCRFVVYRNFDEKAPATWNTATHMGGLYLEMSTTFGSNWDGNPNEIVVHKFSEAYTVIASKIFIPHRAGILVWLRGGGAVYHAYTDTIETNKTLQAEVLLQGYDNPPYNPQYSELEVGKAGTYEETGAGASIKALSPKESAKNAYDYAKNAYDYANTVQGALEQGDFTITGRTVFDGSARFVSRGTNEVITIANGSIDFHRDGQRLTRIKNIAHGMINTDSQGKGVVDFEGFKQPMVVHTSIKSANFGKNMAQVFCYAEHITNTQYRFFVGGTNEYWVEASHVKVVGTEWKADNAMNSSLSSIEGRLQGFSERVYSYQETTKSESTARKIKERIRNIGITTYPKFNLKVIRIDGAAETILSNKDFTVGASYEHDMPINGTYYRLKITLNTVNIGALFSLLKTYTARTNVKFKIIITILEKDLNLELWNEEFGRRNLDNGTRNYKFGVYKGTAYSISMSDFVGMAITASASTSTLGGVTGTGEVSYIAMEID